MKLWIWYWQGGGYNSCRAETRGEALEKARAMGVGTVLKVDESTLHEGTPKELLSLDRQYASLVY